MIKEKSEFKWGAEKWKANDKLNFLMIQQP